GCADGIALEGKEARPGSPPAPVSRIFLLSPAHCDGQRAALVLNERAEFDLARRLRGSPGTSLGEIFSFLSGLYFRGTLAYAQAFPRPPSGPAGVRPPAHRRSGAAPHLRASRSPPPLRRGRHSSLTGSPRLASLSRARSALRLSWELRAFLAACRLHVSAREVTRSTPEGSTWHDEPGDGDTARARAATWRAPCVGGSAARCEAGRAAKAAGGRAGSRPWPSRGPRPGRGARRFRGSAASAGDGRRASAVAGLRRGYREVIVNPPSTTRVCPVTQRASSLARYTAAQPTSQPSPSVPSTLARRRFSRSSGPTSWTMGVHT